MFVINLLNLNNCVAFPLNANRPLDKREEELRRLSALSPTASGECRLDEGRQTSLIVNDVKHAIETSFIKESYWNPRYDSGIGHEDYFL